MTSFYAYGTLSGSNNNTSMGQPTGVAYVGAMNAHGQGFTGTIAEIIVYDRKLSDKERQQVEAYLAAKYDLGIPTKS